MDQVRQRLAVGSDTDCRLWSGVGWEPAKLSNGLCAAVLRLSEIL